MIMPEKCKECLKIIETKHLEELDNQREKLIEEFEKKIDFTFVSMNSYLDLILSDDFNKDDLLNCIHEYGDELKQKLKESKQ